MKSIHPLWTSAVNSTYRTEKVRKYGREYYVRLKMLAMMAMTADDKNK